MPRNSIQISYQDVHEIMLKKEKNLWHPQLMKIIQCMLETVRIDCKFIKQSPRIKRQDLQEI